MIVPGANLLNLAFSVIQKQTVKYYQYLGASTNQAGFDEQLYATPIDLEGSFQAVSWTRIQNAGLDLSKKYCVFYCSHNLLLLDRDTSSDHLEYAGLRYQVQNKDDWFYQDGWIGVLCVRVHNP